MAEILARVERTLSRRVPSVGLDRVCARATLPLSGAGRFLKADSKTHAMLLLRCIGDYLLRRNCLLRTDPMLVGGLLGNVVTENRGQFLAVIRKQLRIMGPARNRDVSHPAVE
jgi:hypothetical protein